MKSELEICRMREQQAEKRRETRPKGPRGVSSKSEPWIAAPRIELTTKVPPMQPRRQPVPPAHVPQQGLLARFKRKLFGR